MGNVDETGREVPPRERAWAVVRLALGLLQMMGAVVALYCLLETGVSELAVGAVVVTCVFTTTSILLFGGRKRGQ